MEKGTQDMADDNAFAAAQLAAALIQAGKLTEKARGNTVEMPFVRKARNDTRSMRRSGSGPCHLRSDGMKPNHGAQYEISIDGVPRTYRDRQDIALQTARFLKSRNPQSAVKLKDLQTGEETVVAFKSE